MKQIARKPPTPLANRQGNTLMSLSQRAAIAVALLFAVCSCGGNLGRMLPTQSEAVNRTQLPQNAADEMSVEHVVPESTTVTEPSRSLIATKQNIPGGLSMSEWAANINLWTWGDLNVAAPHAAGIKTFGYINVNFCSGSTFHDANGRGENHGAEPNCSGLPSSAFYKQESTGKVIATCDCSSSYDTIQYLGNPASTDLQADAVSYLKSKAETYGANNYVEVDDGANLDEVFASQVSHLCNGVGTITPKNSSNPSATYTCPPMTPVTAVDDNKDISGYSASSWLSGEEALVKALPEGVIMNGLNSCDHSGSSCEGVTAAGQVVVNAPNAVGGQCDFGCFSAKDVSSTVAELNEYTLPEQISTLSAVINAKKFVILLMSKLDIPARGTFLAGLMLVYEPNYVYEDFENGCGQQSGETGVPVCPEAGLVFVPSGAYTKSSSLLYTRSGTCYINGAAVSGKCFTEVNGSMSHQTLSTGYGSNCKTGPCAYPLVITGNDYAAHVKNALKFSNSGGMYPSTLEPGQGMIGVVE
jgi:hypothetical protein